MSRRPHQTDEKTSPESPTRGTPCSLIAGVGEIPVIDVSREIAAIKDLAYRMATTLVMRRCVSAWRCSISLTEVEFVRIEPEYIAGTVTAAKSPTSSLA